MKNRKTKGLVPFLDIGMTEHSLYGRLVLKNMIQKVPGRSQNNRARRRMLVILPMSQKKNLVRILISYKTGSRQRFKRNCSSNHFTFICATVIIINFTNKVFERKSLRSWAGEPTRFPRLRLDISAIGY